MRLYMLAVSSFVAGCASPSMPPSPVYSTQGITLVQTAQVMAVRDLPDAAIGNGQRFGGDKIDERQTGPAARSKTGIRLTVLSDNGEVRHYDIASDEIFRVGERIKIIDNNGDVRITH